MYLWGGGLFKSLPCVINDHKFNSVTALPTAQRSVPKAKGGHSGPSAQSLPGLDSRYQQTVPLTEAQSPLQTHVLMVELSSCRGKTEVMPPARGCPQLLRATCPPGPALPSQPAMVSHFLLTLQISLIISRPPAAGENSHQEMGTSVLHGKELNSTNSLNGPVDKTPPADNLIWAL